MRVGKRFIPFIRFSLLVFLVVVPWKAVDAFDRFMDDEHARIVFSPNLESMAVEVRQMVPVIKEELHDIFGWELHERPVIVLFSDRRPFQRLVESPLTVAFAQPERNMVAIDCTRTNRHPLSLRNVVKHELCHLYVHQYVKNRPVPRWLDEGIAQWASDGISDILHDRKRTLLTRAAFTGKLLPLDSLNKRFPLQDHDFILAYEQSKDFVVYLVNRYGKNKVLQLLHSVKEGEAFHHAVSFSLGEPLADIEREWHRSLKTKTTWFAHLSFYIYEFLFAFGAMIMVYGFIRVLIKKRRYLRMADEDDPL